MVQDATFDEVISFDINNELYSSFESLIFTFSDRNYFIERQEEKTQQKSQKA